jgi:hypothetical protein
MPIHPKTVPKRRARRGKRCQFFPNRAPTKASIRSSGAKKASPMTCNFQPPTSCRTSSSILVRREKIRTLSIPYHHLAIKAAGCPSLLSIGNSSTSLSSSSSILQWLFPSQQRLLLVPMTADQLFSWLYMGSEGPIFDFNDKCSQNRQRG